MTTTASGSPAPKLGSDGRWRMNGRILSKAAIEELNLLGVEADKPGDRSSEGWIQTYTGVKFYPLSPDPSAINIKDVAHALSNTCRYNGHTRQFYSVAQHSALVSQNVPIEDALWGLLHDAPEAYLGDMPRPLKHSVPFGEGFRAAEAVLMAAVCERYGLPLEEPESVKEADARLLATEKRDLLAKSQIDMDETEWLHGASAANALPAVIRPLAPKDAEYEFLRMWQVITRGRFDHDLTEVPHLAATRFGGGAGSRALLWAGRENPNRVEL